MVPDQPKSLDVQSVLYLNEPDDIVRAAEFTAHAVNSARSESIIQAWRLLLGDCSPESVLDHTALDAIEHVVSEAGGVLEHRVFGTNLGSAAGHNALATDSESDLIMFLNPDALMAYDTVGALVRAMRSGVGIVEARQLPMEHPKTFEKYTGDTSWASTACALTSREAFDRVGGFDSETFFLYGDDVDYSWRLKLSGYRVVYEPAARIYHDKRLTTSGDWPSSPAEIYYSAEAALMLAHKYSSPDRVKTLVTQYLAEGTAEAMRAVAEYENRVANGTVPMPLDEAHQVSQFVGDNYAVHRF
jgi:hypothetical protein